MRKPTKSVIAAGLLAAGVLTSAALYAHGGMMSGDSMMGNQSGESMMGNGSGGMMGMMQQMSRMMENCNKMMESHAETQPKPDTQEDPAG